MKPLFTHVHKASTRKFYGQKIYSGKSMMASKRYTDIEERKKLMREKSIKRLFMIWYGSVLSDIPREIYIQWREYVTREQDTRMPSWGRAKYVWLIIQKRLTLRSQRKILVELCSILWIRSLFVYLCRVAGNRRFY